MDKKTKVLVTIMVLAMALSAVAIYYRTMVTKNFPIVNSEGS